MEFEGQGTSENHMDNGLITMNRKDRKQLRKQTRKDRRLKAQENKRDRNAPGNPRWHYDFDECYRTVSIYYDGMPVALWGAFDEVVARNACLAYQSGFITPPTDWGYEDARDEDVGAFLKFFGYDSGELNG